MKKLVHLFKIINLLLVFNSLNLSATEKGSVKFSDEKSDKFAKMIFTGSPEMDFKQFVEFVKKGVEDPEIDINYIHNNYLTPLTAIISTSLWNPFSPSQRFEVFRALLESPRIDVNIPKGDWSPLVIFVTFNRKFGNNIKEALKLLIKKGANPTEAFFEQLENDPTVKQMYAEILDEMSALSAPPAPPAPMPQFPKDKGDSKEAAESGKES